MAFFSEVFEDLFFLSQDMSHKKAPAVASAFYLSVK
jgi:hypothetical protein